MPNAAPFIARHDEVLARFSAAAQTAEIVSFDVFDTLLVRFFGDPADLFKALAERVAPASSADFARGRVAAEQRARTAAAARGEREVTLASIYRELKQAWAARGLAQALDFEQAAREEMDLELRCARADLQVVAAFQALVAAGRRIVLVSDMYLPAECVERMLARCGIAGFERLYLSSEIMVAKADGSVWPYLRAVSGLAPDAGIVHLGDNPQSDGETAHGFGVIPFLLVPPGERRVASRLARRGHWLADSFASLLRQELVARHGESGLDPYWLAIAYLVVAPAALGMAGHVRRVAQAHGTDHVFFLARDGLIFQTAYEAAWRPPGALPSRYVWCSRRCANFANISALDEASLDFLTSGGPVSPEAYLRRIDLDPADPAIRPVLARFFPDPSQPVRTMGGRTALRAMFTALAGPIQAQAAVEREALLAHLDGIGLYDGPGVVVDLGWHGSLQRSLMLLGRARSGVLPLLAGAYLGTFGRRVRTVADAPLDASGWLFNGGLPRDSLARFTRSVEITELLFSAPEPGIRCVRRQGTETEPVRIVEPREADRLRLAAIFHDAVAKCAEALRPVLVDGHVDALASLTLRGFDALLGDPAPEDVAHFGGIAHAEGFGVAHYRPIIPIVPPASKAKARLDALDASFWRRGFLRSLAPGARAQTVLLSAVQTEVRRARRAAARLRQQHGNV
jgi:FMN phosphatase YigB (HAD superfamily)